MAAKKKKDTGLDMLLEPVKAEVKPVRVCPVIATAKTTGEVIKTERFTLVVNSKAQQL